MRSMRVALILAFVLAVLLPGKIYADEIDVLTGTSVTCSAETSQGHPERYEWFVLPPGSPESSKPYSTEESFSLLIDRSGTWQIELWVYYAHLDPEGYLWISRKSASIHAASVVAVLSPLQQEYTIEENLLLDGSDSSITIVANARFLADGNEIPGCTLTNITNPIDLECTIAAGNLDEGNHEITLELTSGNDISSDSRNISIVNPPPFNVDFTWSPENPDPDETTTVNITVADGYTIGDLAEMRWYWDDGSELETVDCPPPFLPDCSAWSHHFTQTGYYDVVLEVTTTDDITASVQHRIQVGSPPPPPTADFSMNPAPGLLREAVSFSFTGSCEGDCIWDWDFGDQNDSNADNPTHNYLETGIFTVSLDVNNSEGSDSTQAQIQINNCWTPESVIQQSGFCYGAPISLSAPAANTYEWSSGAGSREITVSQPGTYYVYLAQGINSCWARLEHTLSLQQCSGNPLGNVTMDVEGRVDAYDIQALLREIGDDDGDLVESSGGGYLGAPGADLGGEGTENPDGHITSADLLRLVDILYSQN